MYVLTLVKVDQAIHDLLDDLETNPVVVSEEGMLMIKLAETLAALVNGTITPAVVGMLPSRNLPTSVDECRTSDCVIEYMGEESWSEFSFGVYCTDSPDSRNITEAEMVDRVEGLKRQSLLFGVTFALSSRLVCAGYPIRPKWRFDGPFGDKTKTPVLFIGNSLDPVAPLEGTKLNVPKFEGARLLQ
ncbi:uncharacterized protein LY79DRAFT_706195 [Colletotrichum navitas]|uniref:Peptidase S33 tripeptidyl aminopeptidase-like C-terminal domain-containing protein n=1 Tax=Colletotrichum navitas TaxID=681940 RepID=A0AAD8PR46_9PEZI|nr:uncharacterized protein LY79DRAFT_706195 [Colletotrichum navitas]KAK1579214.1 hypothetical protein LY79DRAFT_706195 [Colletotrichum navitas]